MNANLTPLVRAVAAAAALTVALVACSGGNPSNGQSAGGTQNAAGAQASPEGGSPAGRRRLMAQALMGLGLTDAQKEQIRSIMADARAKNQGADQDTRRANFKAAFAKIATVLTPDQQKLFQAKLAELRRERDRGTTPQS